MASFRFAQADTDDSDLIELSHEAIQTQLGEMIFSRKGSFLASLAMQYSNSKVIVCQDKGRLLGMGVCSHISASIFGEAPVDVGYLNQLRSRKDARGLTFLVRAYRFLEVGYRQQRLPIYLTTILEDNQYARKILESGRAGLPSYKRIARLGTLLMRSSQLRKFTCVSAGMSQQFSLSTSSGLPMIWDQRGFRSIALARPTPSARIIASALFRSFRPLASKKIDIPIRYLSNWSFSPSEFPASSGSGFFALTLDERDERFSLARKYSSHTIYSILYGVEWEKSAILTQLTMSSAPVFIDAGLL